MPGTSPLIYRSAWLIAASIYYAYIKDALTIRGLI
jgi:hypothetical protein